MTNTKPARRRPAIHMIDNEAETLTTLAISAQDRLPEVCELLLEEIGRAHLHRAERIPADVVTMMSTVEFTDEASGARRTVELVYPRDADISANRISILTQVGAGLIGLSEGQSIKWPGRNGTERVFTIDRVSHPAAEPAAPENAF